MTLTLPSLGLLSSGDFWRGAFLCGSLVITIGAQVSYLLRQGILRAHVGKAVAVCVGSDLIFISAGVAGAAALLQQHATLIHLLVYLGAAYLTWFGVTALRRAWRGNSTLAVAIAGGNGAAAAGDDALAGRGSRRNMEPALKVMLTMAALTWLNPHVYIDAILILGSTGAHLPAAARQDFLAGAIIADILCFTALGYGARLLTPLFAKPLAWRLLDVTVGVVVLSIAASQINQ
ncbi:MAG TPA: LysE family transporter [Terriglobales bacterium]|nr:LysE family transporter [Terriglobales bacterium]